MSPDTSSHRYYYNFSPTHYTNIRVLSPRLQHDPVWAVADLQVRRSQSASGAHPPTPFFTSSPQAYSPPTPRKREAHAPLSVDPFPLACTFITVADGTYFVFTLFVPSPKSQDICANAFKTFLRRLSEGSARAKGEQWRLTTRTYQSTRAERMIRLLTLGTSPRGYSSFDILIPDGRRY